MTTQNWQLDRKLDVRSYLKFEFPTPSTKTINITLPFFSNISIRESKKSNLVKYKPIGRSSSLYTYTGAESRELALEFDLILPHLTDYSINFGNSILTPVTSNPDLEKEKFKLKGQGVQSSPNNYDKSLPQNVRKLKQELASTVGTRVGGLTNRESTLPVYKRNVNLNSGNVERYIANFGEVDSPLAKFVSPNLTIKEKTVEVIAFWVNLIRASVINNANDPLLGPPIIRVYNGILYRGIPCVCTDYSISDDPRAGMEVSTLLPRSIKVSMKLEEVRAGNFEKFSTNNQITNPDGLAGWESVINAPYTIDPQK